MLATLGQANIRPPESACYCVGAALRALKQESPDAELPVLVVDADRRVTSDQLTDILVHLKHWGADKELAKFVVVLSSARAALSTDIALKDMRVHTVLIGDLTDSEAVEYCTTQLKQWHESNVSVLTDAALRQLARDMVNMVGNRVLSFQFTVTMAALQQRR